MKDETKKIFSDFDAKLDLVVEGNAMMKEELTRKLEGTEERLWQKIGDVESTLKFISLELRLIKAEVTEIRKNLTRKADLERLEALEKRVGELEKLVAQQT